MKIIDKWNDQSATFCTIELEPGVYVDIKVIKETGLIYIMQNEDGTLAYGDKSALGYQFDEKAAIAMVAANLKEGTNSGPNMPDYRI